MYILFKKLGHRLLNNVTRMTQLFIDKFSLLHLI